MVFLFDVDNTLLDNEAIKVELRTSMGDLVGLEEALTFWNLYEEVRADLGFVHLPETLERFAQQYEGLATPRAVSDLIYGFDFAGSIFPGALEAVEHARELGLPVILSDGDQLFQRHKIHSAGLYDVFEGRVLVYAHKEREVADIRSQYPADRYVILDDKPRIHASLKEILGQTVTTILVKQGRYAEEPLQDEGVSLDLQIPSIGAFCKVTAEQLRVATSSDS